MSDCLGSLQRTACSLQGGCKLPAASCKLKLMRILAGFGCILVVACVHVPARTHPARDLRERLVENGANNDLSDRMVTWGGQRSWWGSEANQCDSARPNVTQRARFCMRFT